MNKQLEQALETALAEIELLKDDNLHLIEFNTEYNREIGLLKEHRLGLLEIITEKDKLFQETLDVIATKDKINEETVERFRQTLDKLPLLS